MSVLCCQTPDFLLKLAYRSRPEWQERPFALVGSDELLCAVSPQAIQAHVQVQMTPRQAQMRCPEIVLQPVDVAQSRAEQEAFLDVLTRWQLPVEASGWGQAYIDLHTITCDKQEVQPLAADLGKQLRTQLGEAMQPSLGWDSGKFTARAAAHFAAPGKMRLVSASDESRFLSPLPITLLPLPPLALQQLSWLGIRTLGQFAQLPTQAVWQRFGQTGKLAQQWAKGKDDRPVQPTAFVEGEPEIIDIDPPTDLLSLVVQAVIQVLTPQLVILSQQLAGVRCIRFEIAFVEGSKRVITIDFVEPVTQVQRVEAALTHKLQQLEWCGEVSKVTLLRLERGELAMQQLALFTELDERSPKGSSLAQRLGLRYGAIFFQALLQDAQHPVAERRFVFDSLL